MSEVRHGMKLQFSLRRMRTGHLGSDRPNFDLRCAVKVNMLEE